MKERKRSGSQSAAGRPAGAEPLPLLATKLYRPSVTPDLEPRTRLMERLERNRHRPLTLISAPAGYGKTMLASLWLQACDCPSAWVSLDESDNDLLTFASYLLAALQSAFPAHELKTWSLLAAPVLPPAPVLARYLLNDLAQIPEPFLLALDDVHLIRDQAVLDLLSELLRHPSPSMSLVLIGRRDPLLPIASLRAHRQVTEVRVGDLRFTPQEAARLLGRVLGREIDEATASEWTERTEGWVTGLLLAALSLRQGAETEDVRRDIPEHSLYLQDYLMAEVLAHLPPERREWLLLTSLLDRFCAPLCEVVGQSEAAAGATGQVGIEFIRWLQKENLFSISLDDRGEWFRFHHLFQQLLQDRLLEHLPPEEIAAAHRRASCWLAGEGLIEEALVHALAAGDTGAAVQVVIQQHYHLMNTQQWHRLERLLRRLPADALAQSSHLASAKAHLALQLSNYREVAAAMQQAARLLAALPPESEEFKTVQAEISVVRSVSTILLEQSPPSTSSAQETLRMLPLQAHHIRSTAQAALAAGLQMQGEFSQGVEMLREARADPAVPPHSHAGLLHYFCLVCFLQGELGMITPLGRDFFQMAEGLGLPWLVSQARHHLGVAHYLRNEHEQAETYLLALLRERATSAPTYMALGVFALALIHAGRGCWAEAWRVLDLAYTQIREVDDLYALMLTESFRVELALRQGELAEARRLSIGVEFEPRPPSFHFYVPQLTAIKLVMAEGTPNSLERARAALELLDEKMSKIHRNMVRIQSLSLLALVCDAQGEPSMAYDRLTQALLLAEPGGFIRDFVGLGPPMADLLNRLRQTGMAGRSDALSYVDRILAAFGPRTDREQPPATGSATGPSSPHIPSEAGGLIEPLTRREREVLALLAQRLTYQEIAARLFISHGTVGQHTVSIYQKLQVNNRRQAIAKAQALGLLSQQ